MVIDRYTKFVLTVIAFCLIWLAINSPTRPLEAQALVPVQPTLLGGKPQPVVIVGWGTMSEQGQIALNLVTGSNGTRRTDATLPVRLPSGPLQVAVSGPLKLDYTPQRPLPIGITEIKKAADWEAIKTTSTQ
jgi:hypothetical protein